MSTSQQNQQKYKMLITEDDLQNQQLLAAYLGRQFDVSVCDSDVSFYQRLEEKKYDVFLMDIAIKGSKDGLELVKELRNLSTYSDTPIVCYTAHVLQRDRLNAYKAGCDLFLGKPLDNKILLESINKIIESKPRPSHN